jgi:hypothetical protein
MTDTIPTNATPTASADLGAFTWHPTVVKLRELFFDVLSFELGRFTALGDGAAFLCWRSKDRCIAWARLDLFAKPTRDNPRRLVLRVVINKGPVDVVANVARRRGLLVERELWRSPSWALEAFVTLDELLPPRDRSGHARRGGPHSGSARRAARREGHKMTVARAAMRPGDVRVPPGLLGTALASK